MHMHLGKAGLRTLHEIGPELKRAISGNLETDFNFEDPEPQHRRTHSLFNNIVNRIAGTRSPSDHGDRGLWQIAPPAAVAKPTAESRPFSPSNSLSAVEASPMLTSAPRPTPGPMQPANGGTRRSASPPFHAFLANH
ncbi:hypothetical protein ANCCAN_19992 [Ancylostoma caninum]|uniref:Uncharacterized protein n=1 Tax=Ancylostoma caninum TaxID=29170 RepID=A0A368FQ29_ANCCA|nr:hypothetical protein ANCCAN_19992 [Ancylostoma caninum]